jgi:hypothetical protein
MNNYPVTKNCSVLKLTKISDTELFFKFLENSKAHTGTFQLKNQEFNFKNMILWNN